MSSNAPVIRVVGGFPWLMLTPERAKEFFNTGAVEVYQLHDDGSESLVEDALEFKAALKHEAVFGLELAHSEAKTIWITGRAPTADDANYAEEVLVFTEEAGVVSKPVNVVDDDDTWTHFYHIPGPEPELEDTGKLDMT